MMINYILNFMGEKMIHPYLKLGNMRKPMARYKDNDFRSYVWSYGGQDNG